VKAASITAAVAAALAGCEVVEPFEPDVGPPLAGACDGADSDPDTDVSFARDLRPLLERPRGEAGCGCHSPGGGRPIGIELGGLDLGSVAALRRGGHRSGTGIVVPGDPCASALMHKISATPEWGSRMPLDGPPYLSAAEIQLIHDWIAEGARDR
jgi:hypothetical protein